jgi:4-amino-4-deoxy-L-arabinose transferase-like glycosyltransferase
MTWMQRTFDAVTRRYRMRTSEGLTATAIVVHKERRDIDQPHERLNQILIPLLVLVAAVYLATAGVPRLFDQIDGQYAGAAREMIARGDWLTPTQDGIPRLQKPPLVYWCEILSLRLFGQNEFAARLPVALTTVAWFVVTAALVERLSSRRIFGICAALILATFLGTYLFTHLVMPEPFSALFLICTLYGLVCALQTEPGSARDRWLLLAWFFIALGTLTKGLHALLIPVAIGAASYTFKRSTREVWRRFFLGPHGWVLFFALVTPWYVAMELRYPGSLADQLGNEQLGNLFNHRWPVDSDRVPLPQFFLEHVALLFPWSLFLPGAVVALWRSRKSWLNGEGHVLLFFLVVNVLGILFAKIQDYYLLISWPVVAIGLASFFVSGRSLSRRLSSIPGWLLVAIGIAGLFTAVCLIWRPIGTGKLVDLVTDGRTVWEGLGGILSEHLSGLGPLILIASCALTLAGAAIVYFARQANSPAIVGSGAVLMIVLFLTSTYGLHLVEDQFSSAKVASKIEQLGGGNYEVVCEFEANDLTSLFFYLPHSIQWLNANPEMEFATRSLGIGRDLYLPEERFRKLWDGDRRTFLIADQGRLDHWRSLLHLGDQRRAPVAIVGTKMILMNR